MISLKTIIDILNVIDRPDIKSKLTNALRQYSEALLKLENVSGINIEKLKEILERIDQKIHMLYNMPGKLGETLYNNEFLTAVRQRINIAGGSSDFALPALYLWQQNLIGQQQNDISKWLDELAQIKSVTESLTTELSRS